MGSHVTGSHVNRSDVSHVTRSDASHVPCPEACSAHAQPKLRHFPPSGAFMTRRDVSHVTGRGPVRKWPWPEVCSPHARSLDHFSFSLGLRIRNRKLRNTRGDPFGSVLGVFSTTSASYNHRKPRVLYLAWLLELALVVCSFYFRIVSI
jgi:hypothetical protein